MKKEELDKWITEAKLIDCVHIDYDESSNQWASKIFKRDEKYYQVDFCNGHPFNKWTRGKGYSRIDYAEPIEVERKTQMIEQVYYEPIENILQSP